MYYKLYRRRHYIYIGAVFLGIFLYLTYKSHTIDYENGNVESNYENYKGKSGNDNNKNKNIRKSRITMETYKAPDPCVGCPGENGQGVYLTVNMIYSKILKKYQILFRIEI